MLLQNIDDQRYRQILVVLVLHRATREHEVKQRARRRMEEVGPVHSNKGAQILAAKPLFQASYGPHLVRQCRK